MQEVVEELYDWINQDMLLFSLFDEVWRDVMKLPLNDLDEWEKELSGNTLVSIKMVCCPPLAPRTLRQTGNIYREAIKKLCHFLLSCGDEDIANQSVQIFSEGIKVTSIFLKYSNNP